MIRSEIDANNLTFTDTLRLALKRRGERQGHEDDEIKLHVKPSRNIGVNRHLTILTELKTQSIRLYGES